MKKNKLFLMLFAVLFTVSKAWSVSPDDSLKYANWQNKHPELDKTWGAGTDKAYKELIKNRKSKTVIVAVIDNGVDINHEDLKDHIWVNKDEIPGNGIDDDNNGFIDDIHGWNFLGNSNGENIDKATMEVTRLYQNFEHKYNNTSLDSIEGLSSDDYEKYKKIINDFEIERNKAEQEKAFFDGITRKFSVYDSIMTTLLGKDDYSISELKKLKVEKKSLADSARKTMIWFKRIGVTNAEFEDYKTHLETQVNFQFNTEFTPRKDVLNDNAASADYAKYGNNDVAGENPDHGTMVSGIICATRNNGIGMNGVADNVKIMAIRTVPDGDEWDKDVANAIRYAIENGAEIINMSFGKGYSPQKNIVDQVVKMANEHNVLLVHAAGNDSENNDSVFNYPRKYDEAQNVLANNWMTIGASAKDKKKKKFVASFSNYGKKEVDLFAPGHNIYTCAPGNTYDIASGTSFAAPMVAGAAALIKSYYPSLTSIELKDILLESSATKDIKVVVPGTHGKNKLVVPFSDLSATGGLLNVYKALVLAEKKTYK